MQADGSTCHSTGNMSGACGVLGPTADEAMSDIRQIALNNGWKRRRISGLVKWVCPACDERMKEIRDAARKGAKDDA